MNPDPVDLTGTALLSALLALGTFPAAARAQDADLAALQAGCRARHAEILEEVARVHNKQANIGVQAAVALDGAIVFFDALGMADLEHGVPVTRQTVLGVASVTKAFTGALALMVAEERALDVDAPIQRYVPEFPEREGGPITPRLLAGHLAGIRHYRDERTPALYATHYDDIRETLDLFAGDSLLSAPGTEYHYSSYGYNLLAMAIQAAAGRPFQQLVRERILEPLGLDDTAFDDVRFPVPHRSERYSYYHPTRYTLSRDRPWLVPRWDYSYNTAGGNLRSTARDLVRFGQSLLEPGLLGEASLERLRRPIREGPVTSRATWGWFPGEDASGRPFLRATGSNAGVQASLVVYPEQALSVAVLANTWGLGSRSAEMVVQLPARMAGACLGW